MVQPKSKTGNPLDTAANVMAKPALSKPPFQAPAPKVAAKPAPFKAAAPDAEPTKVEPVAAPIIEAAPALEATPVQNAVSAAESAPDLVTPADEPAELAPLVETAPVLAPATTEASVVKTPILSLKDFSMTTDFTATMTDAVTEVQAKLQTAYDKSASMVTEMTDLAKGNVEAVVESTKLFAAGVQDLGKSYADEAKSAYEIATADLKEMAAIKSPTELFQLQGKILRRNFENLIAATSKSTDAALKLANEAMAPISGRVNVATEKLSKIAA